MAASVGSMLCGETNAVITVSSLTFLHDCFYFNDTTSQEDYEDSFASFLRSLHSLANTTHPKFFLVSYWTPTSKQRQTASFPRQRAASSTYLTASTCPR